MVQGTPVLLRITVFFHITNMIGPLSNNMEHIHPLKLPFFIPCISFRCWNLWQQCLGSAPRSGRAWEPGAASWPSFCWPHICQRRWHHLRFWLPRRSYRLLVCYRIGKTSESVNKDNSQVKQSATVHIDNLLHNSKESFLFTHEHGILIYLPHKEVFCVCTR